MSIAFNPFNPLTNLTAHFKYRSLIYDWCMPKLKRPLIMTGISKFSPNIKVSISIPKRENKILCLKLVFLDNFSKKF